MIKGKFFIFFCFYSFLLFANSKIYAQAFKRLFLDDPVIEISLRDLNGKQISLAEYKDKKILAVIFFKNPSLRGPNAIAYWQKLYEKYRDSNNFSVISVYCPRTPQGIPSDELNDLQKLIAEKNITYPVLLDEGLNIFSKYGVISLPSSMIVDTKGIVKYIIPGFPTFGAEKDISTNLKKILGIPEEKIIVKKYEPDLDAGRNYKLAVAVMARGNTDKAIDYLNIAVSKDPKYPAPYALLGNLYTRIKKTDKAMENYQKALELDSEDVETLINYGFLCMDQGMKEDALLQFKNIIEIAPQKSAEAYFGMGTIYLKNEVFDSAMVKVKEAIKLYGTQKDLTQGELIHLAMSYLNLAEIHMKSDNKKEAIEQYREAIKKYDEVTQELVKETEKSVRAN